MGLDIFIERRKKNDTNAPWKELFYARKFWELLDADFVKEYNDSKNFCYVEARINSEDDFDELIDIAEKEHEEKMKNNYTFKSTIIEKQGTSGSKGGKLSE